MLKVFYLLNCLFSIGCLIYYFENAFSKVNLKQIMVLVLTAITNYAFTLSVFADNLEGVYVASQIYYCANVFSLLIFLFVIAELCNHKVIWIVRLLLVSLCFAIIIFYSTTKDNHLYYKTMEFVKVFGISSIKRTYGPCHRLLFILILLVNGLSIYYVVSSLLRTKESSRSTLWALIILMVVATILYMIPKLIHAPLDFMPFVYSVIDIFLVFLFRKANLYDMTSNLLNVYERRFEYGYIALDKKYRYLTSNEFAKQLFPILREVRTDTYVSDVDPKAVFCTKLLPWIDEWIAGEKKQKQLVNLEKTITCNLNEIKYKKKVIGYLVELRDTTQQQKYIDLINNYNMKLHKEVENKTRRILEIQDSIISGMATMVESRDNSTGGHIKRTSDTVKIFIEKLKTTERYSALKPEFCEKVIKAAPMHDLGKIAVDDVILRKPGKYTPEEYAQMKKHAAEGAKIVNIVLQNVDDVEFRHIAVNVAHFHHEHWDGEGYPIGLKKDSIPLEARIMALADVFDALVSKRCYKEPFTYDEAFRIIRENLGTHFDPDLGAIFLQCRMELENLYTNYEDEEFQKKNKKDFR